MAAYVPAAYFQSHEDDRVGHQLTCCKVTYRFMAILVKRNNRASRCDVIRLVKGL